MKLFVFAAALAGSAMAAPIRAHRRSVAHHDGTHYQTKYNEAHEQYLSFKKDAEEAKTEADRWEAIAAANKEAYEAYGTQADHKKVWDDHVGARDQLFDDFLAPKHTTYSEVQAAYEQDQEDLDALLAEYFSNHTQRAAPIKTNIANNQQGYDTAQNAINQLEIDIETKEGERDEYKRKLDIFTQDLLDEELDYEKFYNETHDKKEALAIKNGVWNNTHEIDWADKAALWNQQRDHNESLLESAHKEKDDAWLIEKLEADVSNGFCPCQNGGTCDEDVGQVDDYLCDCLLGYEGDDCEVDLDGVDPVAQAVQVAPATQISLSAPLSPGTGKATPLTQTGALAPARP